MERARIDVALTNETEGHRFSDFSEVRDDVAMGELFREAQREHGRCMSKIYVDIEGHAEPVHVGWYFEKRDQYSDSDETYLRGAWVTVTWVRKSFTKEGE